MKNIIFITFAGYILVFFKFIDTIYAAPNYISDDYKEHKNKIYQINNHFSDASSLYKSNDNLNYQKKSDQKESGLYHPRSQFKDTCKSVTLKAKSEDTKKCVLDKLKKTRCVDTDILCLCDSKASHRVIQDCSEFPKYDLTFGIYFDKLCFSAALELDCISPPDPSFPTVICKDLFEGSGLDENARNCMRKAVKHSMCKNISYISCLCDSRSFSYEISECIKDPSFGKKVGTFLNTLCRTPSLLPGCSHSQFLPQVIENEENTGERLYKIKMKEIIFLMLGITIPISLRLMEI
ncbi:hypothetical protein PNEG_02411 [Pneumocystis murina B123]|uniref:CFEM domain-containing protein n=1 Tax=Pneumocystis murina (strain B123) TaxID=1069680 RepID=M7PG80_PNEMU|nr:hypothetical protein PNEG_02411 [Pneumocystis murina B123]EMR09469.1 hypothetical protein PNEG_02411 [Pneumocystis murina B123]